MSDVEPLEDFRARARSWIRDNLKPSDAGVSGMRGHLGDDEELALVTKDRELQRTLFDGGFAGITIPTDYGGQGLTAAHQAAFNVELTGYEYPERLTVPTFSPCLAVILEFGTDEQKRRHVPETLKGDRIWIQFLSEPSGGSDVAGALTTATRDGDEWVLNGSKIWSSGAWWSDWALCLARTNWDAPKHRGLSVFMLPVDRDGVEIRRIEMLDGNLDFCEEFLTDVRVPEEDRLGDVDQGWTVGSRWMVHERMGHNSPIVTMPPTGMRQRTASNALVDLVVDGGRGDDPYALDRLGEARTLTIVGEALNRRLATGMAKLDPQAPAIGRLFNGMAQARRTTIAFDLAGEGAGAWADDEADTPGTHFLVRQSSCIGGGTTEIARNVIAERVLGMPREPAPGRDTPFREVPKGRS